MQGIRKSLCPFSMLSGDAARVPHPPTTELPDQFEHRDFVLTQNGPRVLALVFLLRLRRTDHLPRSIFLQHHRVHVIVLADRSRVAEMIRHLVQGTANVAFSLAF